MLNSARQAAGWIAENPQADIEAVQALCDSLGVDAIHFVDTNGLVALSNEAEVVGYDLASDEQSKPFLSLLSGEADELAQAPAPEALTAAFGVSQPSAAAWKAV